MDTHLRYAVYYVPEPGPLATFAAAWLGWDPVARTDVPHPEVGLSPREVENITSTPRRYGFHATIKPPFRLKQGSDLATLEADLSELARRLVPVDMTEVTLKTVDGFLALVPSGGQRKVAALAAEVVSSLDRHRAPPLPAELTKRRSRGLTDRQDKLLVRWGYPYVMDEFRFHLTLSHRLNRHEAGALADLLWPHLEPIVPHVLKIKDLCLMAEAEDGRFHILRRYDLTGPCEDVEL